MSFLKRAAALLMSITLGLSMSGCKTGGEESSSEPSSASSESIGMGGMSEIVSVTAFDGYRFDGKLSLPEKADKVEKLVIFVNGSGPNTYDNHRNTGEKEFNYFDLFAEEFTNRGMGFYSYNTRGVTPGDTPPLYANIDEEAYQTYLPTNEVKDIVSIINTLKEDVRLKDAKVLLLGWSAGTIVAPLTALENEGMVDALLLAGYVNDTLPEVLEWQQSGGSSMVFYRQYFDYNGDGVISPEEIEEDRSNLRQALGITSFEMLDINQDGYLDEVDFNLMLKESREQVFRAFENGDDAWLRDNYGVLLTSAWYQDYKRLAPNRETLLKLDIPIYIFHGEFDGNVDVAGAQEIEKNFAQAGKTNLTVQIFPDGDHNLNYMNYIATGEIPEGILAIFEAASKV